LNIFKIFYGMEVSLIGRLHVYERFGVIENIVHDIIVGMDLMEPYEERAGERWEAEGDIQGVRRAAFQNLSFLYTYIRIYVWVVRVAKKKLTLSVGEDLLDEVKRIATMEGRSLSSIVEEYFEYVVFRRWAEALGGELGLGGLEPTAESDVPRGRPRGLDAARMVRELRGERSILVEQG